MKAIIIYINNGVHQVTRVESCKTQGEVFDDFGVSRPKPEKVIGYTWSKIYIVRGNAENGTAVAFS